MISYTLRVNIEIVGIDTITTTTDDDIGMVPSGTIPNKDQDTISSISTGRIFLSVDLRISKDPLRG